jgi:hypothetical protein
MEEIESGRNQLVVTVLQIPDGDGGAMVPSLTGGGAETSLVDQSRGPEQFNNIYNVLSRYCL